MMHRMEICPKMAVKYFGGRNLKCRDERRTMANALFCRGFCRNWAFFWCWISQNCKQLRIFHNVSIHSAGFTCHIRCLHNHKNCSSASNIVHSENVRCFCARWRFHLRPTTEQMAPESAMMMKNAINCCHSWTTKKLQSILRMNK